MEVLICDDEPLAVERLSRLVTELGYSVVATATHAQQAIELVKQLEPDVILLDIQMPEMTGLECAAQLAELDPMPAIIFCTAYDQYAIAAFQTHAVGYLLKPVALQELKQALDNVQKPNQAQLSYLKAQSRQHAEREQRQQIVAKTYRGVELIPVDNIYYFLADQKYITVRHKHGTVLIDETLKELETEFADKFIRVHRNALISIHHLEGLEMVTSGQYQVRCRELDDKLAVSRRHLPQLRERLHQL